MNRLAQQVELWLETRTSIRQRLATDGAVLVSNICEKISMRELSRKTGLSPTYISLVVNGKTTISPEAFLKIYDQYLIIHKSL